MGPAPGLQNTLAPPPPPRLSQKAWERRAQHFMRVQRSGSRKVGTRNPKSETPNPKPSTRMFQDPQAPSGWRPSQGARHAVGVEGVRGVADVAWPRFAQGTLYTFCHGTPLNPKP